MASEGTRPASSQPETNLPPEVLNPRPDDPRRCFICLTDEDPSDPPSSWVNPCPCTLEAHQDCMLSWVTNCERSNKPLLCPVCKSKIELEGPWDPLVALTDSVARKFTRASPILLASSVSLGVQFSLQMYGALALWTFSGREALISYVMGPGAAAMGGHGLLPARDRLGNALVLTNVAPALLIGKLTPWLGNKVFLPTACFYGVYHVMHDDNFLSWPPSPQLAMAIFPYARSMYYNLWREFVFPFEVNLNRKLLGLPELQPQEEEQRNNRENANNNGDGGGGGVLGFLQGILDALDPDDDHEPDANNPGEVRFVGGAEGEQGGMVLELVIEEVQDGDDEFMEVVHEGEGEEEDDEDMPPLLDLPPREPQPANPGAGGIEAQPIIEPAAPIGDAPANQAEGQIPVVVEQPAEGHNHEVPQAPPAQRGLGSILSTVSNSIVSALILPGVSFAMGELLRLALPKSWTARGSSYFWNNHRPGLMQQQWGRSLIGGCLYVVLKDVVRVYTKHRKVAAMDRRRVKNVERKRGPR